MEKKRAPKNKKKTNVIILVFYVGIGSTPPSEVSKYMENIISIVNKEKDKEPDMIKYFIPVRSESRVECIYPAFIVDSEKAEMFEEAITKLQTFYKDAIEEHAKTKENN